MGDLKNELFKGLKYSIIISALILFANITNIFQLSV
jgi:hypothetical protein